MRDDRNIYYYTYLSKAGPVSLFPEGAGRYKIVAKKDHLGSYASLEKAFTAAVTGQTEKAWSEGDLADLDLPGNLDDWQKTLFMSVSRLRPM